MSRRSTGTGTDDLAADNIIVNATNANDVVVVAGAAGTMQVVGLSAQIDVTGASATNDRVTVVALSGDDVVDASGVAAGTALLSIDGRDGDDLLVGGQGNDVISGGDGDDILIGGPGADTLDGGTGDNVLIDGENLVAGRVEGGQWLAEHTTEVNGETVLERNGKQYQVPEADLTVAPTPAPNVPTAPTDTVTESTPAANDANPVSLDPTP
jgi:Ca2+-binding RTX toxin-like protein